MYNVFMLDLHLHLDGSLDERQLTELCKINGRDPSDITNHRIKVDESCKSLNDYLECFEYPLSLLQKEEAIEYAVKSLLERLYEQSLLYAEIRFAPSLSTKQGLTQKEVVLAALKGLNQAPKGIKAQLILCLMRGEGNQKENLGTVEAAKEFLGEGVCAVDLAGAEAVWPNELFEKEFALIRSYGIPFTIHAGEALGADSVKKALEMGTCRIGHGIRAIEDPSVVKELAERKIPLEVCPTSEVDTHCIPSFGALPFNKLREAGVILTINTDDMTVSNITLRDEINKLTFAFKLKDEDVLELFLNSAEAAFLGVDEKEKLKQRIKEGYKAWKMGK